MMGKDKSPTGWQQPDVLEASFNSLEGLHLRYKGQPLKGKILFHLCCGPCAEWPSLQLLVQGLELEGYFYNPNIHPRAEWERRAEGALQLARNKGFSLEVEEAVEEELWRAFPSNSKADHCRICYAKRYSRMAEVTKKKGLKAFTSSLLVSPYQNREQMLQIAQLAAKRHGVEFLPFDFRPGFRLSQNLAKRDGLYRQKFCGCIYSLGESDFKDKISRQLQLDPASLPQRKP